MLPLTRRKDSPFRIATGLLLVVALVGMVVGNGRAQSQRETERKLAQMQRELRSIGEERRQLESKRGAAARRLRQADEQVAHSARQLSRTEDALRAQQRALAELQDKRERLQTSLRRQHAQLAALLRAAYQVGDHAPLKLLLSQDRVGDANRLLAYHRYVQNQRATTIQALTRDLQTLQRIEQDILVRQQALAQSQQQQQQQTVVLQRDRQQQAGTVAELETRYQEHSAREQAIGQDTRALEKLLSNLRLAAARAEAERRAAAKRAAEQAAATAKRGGSKPGKTPPRVVANAPAPKVGGLGWPVTGNLLARFGARLPDGRASSGVLIGAARGSTVTAVADGTVVFSDWMTGYGMILIVDHGNGYMSLYAHNESLLRDAGAAVKRGEPVAKVGNSGGQDTPALYFELRRNGQPVDPSSWLQRR